MILICDSSSFQFSRIWIGYKMIGDFELLLSFCTTRKPNFLQFVRRTFTILLLQRKSVVLPLVAVFIPILLFSQVVAFATFYNHQSAVTALHALNVRSCIIDSSIFESI